MGNQGVTQDGSHNTHQANQAMAQISMINMALGMDRDTALETDIATRLAKMLIMAVDMLKKIAAKNALSVIETVTADVIVVVTAMVAAAVQEVVIETTKNQKWMREKMTTLSKLSQS